MLKQPECCQKSNKNKVQRKTSEQLQYYKILLIDERHFLIQKCSRIFSLLNARTMDGNFSTYFFLIKTEKKLIFIFFHIVKVKKSNYLHF